MRQVRCRHLAAALFVTLLAETVRGEWIVRSFMDTIQPFATSTAPCMYFIQEGLAARVWNGNLNGTVKCDKTGTNNIQAYIHETGSNNDVGGYINPDPLSAANGTIPPKTQIDEAVYCGGLSGLQVGSYAVKVVGAEAPIFWTSNTTVNADIVVELVDTFWGFTDAVTVYTNKAEWEAITGGIAPPVMEELTRRLHEAADRHAAETLEARLARLERWIDEQSARQEAPLNASERERLVKLHMAPRTRPPPAHAAVFGTKLGAQRYLELWWDHPDGTKDMNEFVPFGFWKQTLYKMYLQDPSADACCNAPCWQSIGLGEVPPPPPPPTSAQRTEIIDRAHSWTAVPIPYCQCNSDCCGNCPYCGYNPIMWRCDCSGYVSYCLNVNLDNAGYSTYSLPDVTHQISKGELLPGDIMLATCEHTALFAGWTTLDQSSYIICEEPGCDSTWRWAVCRVTAYPYSIPLNCPFLPYRVNYLSVDKVPLEQQQREAEAYYQSATFIRTLSSAINATLTYPPTSKEELAGFPAILAHIAELKVKYNLP